MNIAFIFFMNDLYFPRKEIFVLDVFYTQHPLGWTLGISVLYFRDALEPI